MGMGSIKHSQTLRERKRAERVVLDEELELDEELGWSQG